MQVGSQLQANPLPVDKALQLSAVWSCVRLLSETIATLPVGFYEKTADGRQSANEHPLYELLHNQPNADMTAVEFWEMIMASLLLWGNAYAEIDRTGKRITSLVPLRPERMKVDLSNSGEPIYTYRDWPSGLSRNIDERDIMHIRAFSIMVLWGCHLSVMPVRHLVWQWQQMKPAPKFSKTVCGPAAFSQWIRS
ncbi:phage portal protein [Raoultella planticola]|uniref:phage portal protein n=1 Tax=Raoultella planticola TaxID=575 RepID=UPI002265AAF2|nr:phage portal protein [Raoultella planticola]